MTCDLIILKKLVDTMYSKTVNKEKTCFLYSPYLRKFLDPSISASRRLRSGISPILQIATVLCGLNWKSLFVW